MKCSSRTVFFAVIGRHSLNIDNLKRAILSFYSDDGSATVKITKSANILLLSIDHDNRPFKNATVVSDDNSHIVCPYPIISSIDTKAKTNGLDNIYLPDFIQSVDNPDSQIDSVPPYCYAAHDLTHNRIKIGTDFLGYGKVYHSTQNGVRFYSSHQGVLGFVVGILKENRVWGFTVDDSTPLQDIKVLEPGVMLRFDGENSTRTSNKSLHSLIKKQKLSDESNEKLLERAEYACRSRNGTLLSDKVGSVGLSGGRDNRLIMSLVMAEGLEIKRHRGYPPNAEVDIAEQLVNKSEQTIDWKVVESKSVLPPDGDLLERAASTVFKFEEYSWPSPVRKGLSA